MNKKAIIISIAAILAIAGITTAVIIFFKGNPAVQEAAPPTSVGNDISLEETPAYKACEIVPTDTIKTVLGSKLVKLTDGVRAGAVAPNGETAEGCEYTFTSPQSSKNTLSIQVYQTSPTTTNASNMPMGDPSWFVIPGVTIKDTALYKHVEDTEANAQYFLMSVMTPTKYYLFTISQPIDAPAMSVGESMDILALLANAGKYDISTPTDAPPAPVIN